MLKYEEPQSLHDDLNFGKYQHSGETIAEIIDNGDARYIRWCLDEGIFALDDEAYKYLGDAEDL